MRARRPAMVTVLVALVPMALAAAALWRRLGVRPAGDPDERHGDLTVAEARAVRSVPLYWVGRSFEGLPLTAILGGRDGASFIYGTCEPPPGRDGGCAPPLEIQTLRMCPATVPVLPLSRRRTLRGVPAGSRGGALVLLSRRAEVRVFAGGGRGRRAVETMGAVNPRAPGAVPVGEPLPPPREAAARRVPCSAGDRGGDASPG